jgi:hypothetical protein
MALATTTLSSAVGLNDTFIVVASATSVAGGRYVRVDGEFMQVAKSYVTGTTVPVLRGVDGTATATHKASANVVHGLVTDFANPPAGLELGQIDPITPAIPIFSYSAAGAITPVQGFHIINGTGALAMTLANPTADQDGQLMWIGSNGKAAHTVTYAAGYGNVGATADVMTFNATQQQAYLAIALNGFWCLVNMVAGAATVAGPGVG